MNIRREYIYSCTAFIVLATSLAIMNKGLFVAPEYTGQDGFYEQIMPFMDGIDFSDLQLLQYIHFVRFIIVSPFVIGEVYGLGGVYHSLVIALLAYPILISVDNEKYGYLKYAILLIPIFVSFRTYLVAIGIGYLFVAIFT